MLSFNSTHLQPRGSSDTFEFFCPSSSSTLGLFRCFWTILHWQSSNIGAFQLFSGLFWRFWALLPRHFSNSGAFQVLFRSFQEFFEAERYRMHSELVNSVYRYLHICRSDDFCYYFSIIKGHIIYMPLTLPYCQLT